VVGFSFAGVSRDGGVPSKRGESHPLFHLLGGGSFVSVVPGGFGGPGPDTQVSPAAQPTADDATILVLMVDSLFFSQGADNPFSPLRFQAAEHFTGLCTQFSGLSY
jgi:hypothetical protein